MLNIDDSNLHRSSASWYRRAMVRTYDALHAAVACYPISRAVHVFTAALIVANVAVVILETVPSIQRVNARAFHTFDLVSVAIFTIEYLLRVWSSPVGHPEWPAWRSRVRYMITFFGIVDLLAIAPFYLHVFFVEDLRIVRALRLLRLERLLLLGRYTRGFNLLGRAIKRTRHELYAAIAVIVIALLISSTLIYYVEHEAQPTKFSSIPESLWWGIVTLTSVGYGDIIPITPLGKTLGGLIALLGVGLAALPAGIVAGGFLEEFRRNNEDEDLPEGEVRCPHCGRHFPVNVQSAPSEVAS